MKRQLNKIEALKDVQLSTINKMIQLGKMIELNKGVAFQRAREEVEFVYFQLSGKSIVYNLTNHGKRKILFVYGKGKLINGDVTNYRLSSLCYETIEESILFAISVDDFEMLMKEDFKLTRNILIEQEKKIGRLSHQLKNSASGINVEKKLLSKLWKLSKDFGIKTEEGLEIDINLSITFLADMLGIPRETASRACTVLVKEGLISISGKRITIKNPEQLAYMYKSERKI